MITLSTSGCRNWRYWRLQLFRRAVSFPVFIVREVAD
jgi:hypothetical protein